jgi:hypothetical protein
VLSVASDFKKLHCKCIAFSNNSMGKLLTDFHNLNRQNFGSLTVSIQVIPPQDPQEGYPCSTKKPGYSCVGGILLVCNCIYMKFHETSIIDGEFRYTYVMPKRWECKLHG